MHWIFWVASSGYTCIQVSALRWEYHPVLVFFVLHRQTVCPGFLPRLLTLNNYPTSGLPVLHPVTDADAVAVFYATYVVVLEFLVKVTTSRNSSRFVFGSISTLFCPPFFLSIVLPLLACWRCCALCSWGLRLRFVLFPAPFRLPGVSLVCNKVKKFCHIYPWRCSTERW